jgi:isopenicillin-N N-acyltransferase-like protein
VSTARALPVVELAGTGRQRGEAHGESLRELVLEAVDRWCDNVLARAPVDADSYLTELVDNTGFRRAINRYAPDLEAEVAGIAAAAGTDERFALGLNLMDEEWWLRSVMRGDERLDHCTSVARCAADGEPTLLAQNMDLPAWLDGLQVLLDVSLAGVGSSRATPHALVPSHAGMIGLNALNEYGVGITVNALPQLPVSRTGLPVAFVIRLLASAHDLASATAIVEEIQHASGQNYTIGDRDGAVSMECSAAGETRYDPGGPAIAHSNHPLVAGDVSVASEKVADDGLLLPHEQNSIDRLQHAAAWLGDQPCSVRSLQQLLSEPPVLRGRNGDDGFSFYGVVMECSATPALCMTPGTPGEHKFVHRAITSSVPGRRVTARSAPPRT